MLWMGGSSVDILSLADSPLATAAAAPLLLALSRSSAAAELLTGKGELHWRRLQNASWRAWAVKQRAATTAASWFQPHREHAQIIGGFPTGGRLLRRLASRHRRHEPRRAGAAALAEMRRLRATPVPVQDALPAYPISRARRPSWPVAPASAAAQVLSRAQQAAAKRAARPATVMLPAPVDGALPSGHPLLLLPRADSGMRPQLGAAAGPDGAIADGAAMTGAIDAAVHDGGRLSTAAIDAAALAEVEAALAAEHVAPLPVSQAVALGVSCGGVSGVISRAIVHPLDTLRVLQSVSSTSASAELVKDAAAAGEVGVFQRLTAASEHYALTASRALRDARHAARTTVHNWHLGPASNPFYDTLQLSKSLRILYRGYGLSVLGAQPVYALYFGAYEAAKIRISEAVPSASSSFVQIAAGFLAECAAVALWNPWEVVRQRMQLQTTPRSFIATAEDVIKESGVKGMYAGIGGYLALWGTYSPLMFLLYEQGIDLIYRPRGSLEYGGIPQVVSPSIGTSFLIGSFAGFVASSITSPLDVVKTRMQVQTPTSVIRYDNVLHGLREIANNEGPAALFRGTMARALNNGLSTGIMLGAYGVLRAQMARRFGLSQPAAVEGGSWQPPPHRKQLQSYYSDHFPSYHFPSYDEGAWPARRPPPPPSESAPPPTAAPPRPPPKDAGFIKPLPFLTAIEWSSTPRGTVPGVGAVQVHGARGGGVARTAAPGSTDAS